MIFQLFEMEIMQLYNISFLQLLYEIFGIILMYKTKYTLENILGNPTWLKVSICPVYIKKITMTVMESIMAEATEKGGILGSYDIE